MASLDNDESQGNDDAPSPLAGMIWIFRYEALRMSEVDLRLPTAALPERRSTAPDVSVAQSKTMPLPH